MIKFLYIILAPSYIIYIILRRLFFKKESISLLNLSYYYMAAYSLAAFACVVVFFNIIKTNFFTNNSKTYLQQIIEKHNILYINSLYKIDNIFKSFIRKNNNIKKFYGRYILSFFKINFINKHIYLLFYILPKTIILSCFFIDIFVFKIFHYFFMSLILFLVSLLCDYLFFSLKIELDKDIASIDPLIEIRRLSDKSTIIENQGEIILQLPETIPLKEYVKNIIEFKDDISFYEINLSYYFFDQSTNIENIDVKKILNSYIKYFKLLFDMHELYFLYESQKKKYQTFCTLIYIIIFFVGWITIIYYNIPIIN